MEIANNKSWHRFPFRLTLAITWPQGVLGEDDSHAVAAQVHGGVRQHKVCLLEIHIHGDVGTEGFPNRGQGG